MKAPSPTKLNAAQLDLISSVKPFYTGCRCAGTCEKCKRKKVEYWEGVFAELCELADEYAQKPADEPDLFSATPAPEKSSQGAPGLPVSGYKPVQPGWAIELVNENKALEERCLRQLDKHVLTDDLDQRCVSVARTKIQEAFMWLNRGVFKPERLEGPLK